MSQPNPLLSQPLTLPCGVQLKNRIVKAAMSDGLGDGAGSPTAAQMRLYERWAEGGTALSLIGEVQVSPHAPEKPGNLVLGHGTPAGPFRALATKGSTQGAQIWPQLGHAGALSHGPISDPAGPSPLHLDGLTCRGMTLAEIDALPGLYAQAARLAKDHGFQGVQIHAGHGFLLSQFLSPLFNHRTDAYGGSLDNRFRLIANIVEAVRRAVGPRFPIGIKVNATDRLEGGLTEAQGLEVVKLLDRASVDLIDISGGTYFPGAAASSEGTSASGAYFQDVARRAKAVTSTPILLTGGIRTQAQAIDAIQSGAADAVALARAMVLAPTLPNDWINGAGDDPVFPRFTDPGPGAITAWYTRRLLALGEDREADFPETLEEAQTAYEAWDAARCVTWRARFASGSDAAACG